MIHRSKTRRATIVGPLAVILALTLTPASSAQAGPRDRLLTIINRVRANHDLRTLRLNESLSDDAKRHTRRMIRQGTVSDPRNLRDLLRRYTWSIAGSVSGCNRTLRGLVRAWMGHAAHRDVLMLNRLRRAGIGVVYVDGKSACGRRQYWATAILYG